MRLFTCIPHPDQIGHRADKILLNFCLKILKWEISFDEIKILFTEKRVYLNENLCTVPGKKIIRSCQLHFFWESESEFTLQKKHIIYEDDQLIVFNKPTGLPTQATFNPVENHLFNSARAFLTKRGSSKMAYVGLHHRLDRDTSGLVLMTKKKSANKGVSELFKEHRIQKDYVALVATAKKLPERWKVDNHLKKKKTSDRTLFMHSTKSGGQRAITDFSLIEQSSEYALVGASPKTGRTHQIRVHLSEAGSPIFGDRMYADKKIFRATPRLMLHARSLSFKHPSTGEVTEIATPLPKDFLTPKLNL